MCGIIAVVRRPADRAPPGPPTPCSAPARGGSPLGRRRRATGADDARPGGRPRWPTPRRRSCCAALPGSRALARRPGLVGRRWRPLGRTRRAVVEGLEAAPRTCAEAARRPPSWRRSTPPSSGCKDAAWAIERDRLRTARGRRRPGRRPAPVRPPWPSTCRSSRPCRPSTASRCGAATRPGCTCWCAATGSTSTTRRSAGRSATARRRPALRLAARCAPPTARLSLRLQGGGRDRRAGRQHRGAPRRASPTTSSWLGPSAADDGRGRRARPHPLGQRRHHLAGQRPPAQRRRDRRRRRARTSPPSSTATSTTSPT